MHEVEPPDPENPGAEYLGLWTLGPIMWMEEILYNPVTTA